jgi:hypothetical protein
MCLAYTMLGDGPNISILVRIGPMACTIDGLAATIDTIRNLVGKLFSKANKVTSNQLLLGLQTTWINQVITESNIVDKQMKTTLAIISYRVLVMNFIVMDKILLSTFLAINIPEVFFY